MTPVHGCFLSADVIRFDIVQLNSRGVTAVTTSSPLETEASAQSEGVVQPHSHRTDRAFFPSLLFVSLLLVRLKKCI